MPSSTLTTTPRISAISEHQSVRVLVRQATLINRRGQDVLEAERHVARTAAAVDSLRATHPDFVHLHSSAAIRYVVYLIGLVAVYTIDLLLFGSTGEYVASIITGVPTLILIAKYGFPLFFLVVEIVIATKIQEAREEVSAYEW